MGTRKITAAVLLSAAAVTPAMRRYLHPGDTLIACDAGYLQAEKLGAVPDLILGDFDSAPPPQDPAAVVLPTHKDDTDTHYAARLALSRGAERVTMLGALGGARLEHTLANLATGLFLAQSGVEVLLADERSELRYLLPGRPLTLPDRDAAGPWAYLSVFPFGGPLGGVCISGVAYPLHNAHLTPEYPLGVSNEFAAPTAELRCESGAGLVVLTRSDRA